MGSTTYNSVQSDPRSVTVTAPSGRSGSWLLSLTGVCFLFGILLAMQLRAQQKVIERRDSQRELPMMVQNQIQALQRRVDRETAAADGLQKKVNGLQSQLAMASAGSASRSRQLQAQMQDLQLLAGLTAVKGGGIVITMTDNQQAAKSGGDSAFLPGIVHDFDLLQVVNELRSAKAEAIAIQGADAPAIRVTGFTPIRCVGPVIYVNGEPVAAPFRIQAIGSPDSLASALKMPDGIVDKLSSLFPVRVRQADDLKLPAAENIPKMRLVRTG